MARKLVIKGYKDGVVISAYRVGDFFRQQCGAGLGEAKKLMDRFAEEGRLEMELGEPVPAWVNELDAAGLAHVVVGAETAQEKDPQGE